MDKFITFIGYIQNYVVPSRRNGNRERASASSEKRNHAKNKAYLPQDKSKPRAGLNIRKGSSGSRLNSKNGGPTGGEMEEADGSSETDGIFLRSEVEEARSPRPKCQMFVDKEKPKRFVNVKIESCRSEAVLPPVDTVSTSYSNAARQFENIGVKAAQCETSATCPEKLSQSVKKQATLPSYYAARDLPHDQITQPKEKIRGDNKGNKDLQRSNGLPDIYSTEGKPLVQLRQPSIPNVPIRSKATFLVADTLSTDHVTDDWISPQKDQKSRLKLPKLKKKAKKRNMKDISNSHSGGLSEQGGMAGQKESKNPVEKGGKLCAGESKCEVAEVEKLSEEKIIEGGGERKVINGREQRQQRPRTALGRWLKKRNNFVAPAPFDDLISDARNDGPKKAATETGTLEYEEDTGKESRTLDGVKMAEEITTEDATSFVQRSQSGVNSRLEKVSFGVVSVDADRDCDGLDRKNDHSDSVSSAGGSSSASVRGLGKKHDGKRKQLITLEMKSGIFEAPTVLKKDYSSESCKTVFVKQRVERTSAPFAEETKEEEASSRTEKGYDLGRFYHKESPPRKARPQINEQAFHNISSHKKKVTFNLDQGAAGGVPDSATDRPMSSFLRHNRPARKPSTFLQQFRALTNNDCSSAGTSDPPPPLPDCKPKWHGAAPCLPAIVPEKKQYRKKKELDLEDDFEGWGEPEPAEVKRILERPISAKLPRYPAHWDPLLNERPPRRGGQGYCLGVIWKKPERSALSDSSCDDISEMAREEEETYVFPSTAERAETPRQNLFVDPPFLEHDQCKVEEPGTWCRLKFNKSFHQNPPRRRATEDKVDIQDVE